VGVGGSEGSRVFETFAFLNLTRGLFRFLLTAVTSPREASEHGSASDSESDDEAFTFVPLIRSSILSDLDLDLIRSSILSDLDLDLVTRGSSGSESGLCALCIAAVLGSANGTSVIDTKDSSSEETSSSFRCKRAVTSVMNYGLRNIEDWSGIEPCSA
jgi:hypothetical protein